MPVFNFLSNHFKEKLSDYLQKALKKELESKKISHNRIKLFVNEFDNYSKARWHSLPYNCGYINFVSIESENERIFFVGEAQII